MPNWSYNTLTISGEKAKVQHLFDTKNWSWRSHKNLHDFLHNSNLTMRSWMPMPKTFVEMDTTNHMAKRDALDYDHPIKTGGIVQYNPRFNSDEEYAKYVRKYKNAVKYQKRKYGVVGWYDYNCATLGCKWDSPLEFTSYNETERDGVEYVEIIFNLDTPWSPPSGWFQHICSISCRDVSISMECHEESAMFDFRIDYLNGHYTETELESEFDYEEECDEVE